MIIEPRQYQKDCGNAIVRELSRFRSTLAVMATGLGKTIVATMLVKHYTSNRGEGVLFLAHRETLITQAADKLLSVIGMVCGVEKAERTASNTLDQCVVASVQSLNKERLERYDSRRFGLIIIDEAHLAAADTYLRIIEYFGSAKVVGITATGFRHDNRSLGDIFETVAYEYNLRDAIRDGWLCPIVSKTISLDVSFDNLSMVGGDFSDEDVASTITPILGEIANALPMLHGRRKSLTFLPLVKTSKSAQQAFDEAGFRVRHVDGAQKERYDNIKWFEQWDEMEQVMITNPMMLSVGYDHPPIDSVVWLRPTTSTLLYTQGIGRGTRLYEGKETLFVPDFIMNGSAHDLCRPACLIAESPEMEELMNEIADKNSSSPKALDEIESEAEDIMIDRREAKLAKHIKEFRGMKSKTFDPVLGTMAVEDNSISDYHPRVSEERQSITTPQQNLLEAAGFDPTGWKRGYADLVIKKLDKRHTDGLASPKQLRMMCRQHVKGARDMTYEEASTKIDGLSRKWAYMKKHNIGGKKK